MIYCVWYPSGGFGHFINGVLTLHGKNFQRPKINQVQFSDTGDSHSIDLVAPKWLHDPNKYEFDFETDKNYCVLIDNGIDSENTRFITHFPGAQLIKMCYSDQSWPVVAKTSITKAMRVDLNKELDVTEWNTDQPWAQREKYFLYLRDQKFRHMWRRSSSAVNIDMNDLTNYLLLKQKLESVGLELDSFEDLWAQWWAHNSKYYEPLRLANSIIDSVKTQQNQSLLHIQDIWTQAVIYYYLWLEFDQEVPHNDYENFFSDTNQIRDWLTNLGLIL